MNQRSVLAMLETERSSDEALRQATYRRLYLGACKIKNYEKGLEACYIILLAGRLGLRTGEIQHVREEWIDWKRGEIAIPRHDPCGCKNCWLAAQQKASTDEKEFQEKAHEMLKNDPNYNFDTKEELNEIIEQTLPDDDALPPELQAEENSEADTDDRKASSILYEERWQPKYERSARRIPFGHSERLTGIILEYLQQNEYMEITQKTMNKRVERAAELAHGVDPKNITIRGLRATAATNYATYIKCTKVLQDLMGWTRIETAARYLRRAGGFTTDVVYTVFDKTDVKPPMYPEEPETQFPILSRPIPYQNEPVDPVGFDYQQRKDRADMMSGKPRNLIHPRSQNPPDDIEYDSEKHKILTHDDLESDIVEDAQGKKMITDTTIYEFTNNHERFRTDGSGELDSQRRYESIEEYKEKAIPQSLDNKPPSGNRNQSRAIGVVMTFVEEYTRLGLRLGRKAYNYLSRQFSSKQDSDFNSYVEQQYGRDTSASVSEPEIPLKYKVSFVFTILSIAFLMLSFIAVRTNNYWNPFTGEWNLSPAMAVALLIMSYMSFKLGSRI